MGLGLRLRDALQGMSRKEKLDYIWEYYKIHIVGTIAFLFFVVFIIGGAFRSEPEVLGITVVSEADDEEIRAIEQEMYEFVFDDFDLYFEHVYHESGLLENNPYEMTERMFISLTLGQIDLFVTNVAFIEQLINEDIFVPITDKIDVSRFEEAGHELLIVDEEIYAISAKEMFPFKEHETFESSYIFFPATGRNWDRVELVLDALNEQ
ncbi:hypothetical protein J2T56_002379 [Natronobacillus azotifigens]|uniref:Uncharacterized protein n=1 Tax=Natronobacillus azotifigens TaxID=472978 RepID=A0A9J6RFG0_9BACI|nr:hypothetical protein [Natronobacillus azotifigens]MCZ0704132.1 hypothetical protein [Natronobacillus azotifigens]